MKNMKIEIPINTDCDTPQDVKDLIMALMEECGDRFFSIERVTIDEEEVWKMNGGFSDDMKKHFVE